MGRQKGIELEQCINSKKNARGMHLMQCKYCNHVYVGGPHRVRAHLLGIRGQGVKKMQKCKNASDVVENIQKPNGSRKWSLKLRCTDKYKCY